MQKSKLELGGKSEGREGAIFEYQLDEASACLNTCAYDV